MRRTRLSSALIVLALVACSEAPRESTTLADPPSGVQPEQLLVGAPTVVRPSPAELAPARIDSAIDRVIHSHSAAVRQCYERAIAVRRPELEGRLTLHLVVEGTGKVSAATVIRDASTFEDAEVESCILEVVRALVFPARASGGAVAINYPFVFKAALGR